MTFKKVKKNDSGFTLVESLISATLAVVLSGLAFPFCVFFGKVTNEVLLTQQLNQEAARVSEMLSRKVRPASGIVVADTITHPTSFVDTSYVTVNTPGDTFALCADGKYLITLRAGCAPETLSSCLNTDESNKAFRMNRGGGNIDFNCSLEKTSNGKRYTHLGASAKMRKRNHNARSASSGDAANFEPLINAMAPDPNEHNGGPGINCNS